MSLEELWKDAQNHGNKNASQKQVGVLQGMFKDLGVTDREIRIAIVQRLLNDYSLTSFKDLSIGQATTLLTYAYPHGGITTMPDDDFISMFRQVESIEFIPEF